MDFSDIVVFLCSALGLGSGRIQCLQRAGGAPHRFKRLEVGQLEDPNRYVLSGKGLTTHWSRPNGSWRCTRPLKVEVWWWQYTLLTAWFLNHRNQSGIYVLIKTVIRLCWAKLLPWESRTKRSDAGEFVPPTGFSKSGKSVGMNIQIFVNITHLRKIIISRNRTEFAINQSRQQSGYIW